MSINTNQQDELEILRRLVQNSNYSQRQLAKDLGFSLGKLNYCLKALKAKGLVKIQNFKNNPNKLNYLYFLTAKGFSEKSKLTINFMNLKLKEYEELRRELDKTNEV